MIDGFWIDLARDVLGCELRERRGHDWCESHEEPWPCSRVLEAARTMQDRIEELTKEQKMGNEVMSADRLREAARVLRERAEACLPRQGDDQSWAEAFDADAYEQEHGGDGASDVRYIATMHPGVGLALADWLDAQRRHVTRHECEAQCEYPDGCYQTRIAYRLADLILGAES